jgi:2-keto-3-deoxy-L-fuconate dehydrogenase
MRNLLVNQRVLITQSTEFLGPMLCEVLAEQGVQVVGSKRALGLPHAADELLREVVARLGQIDV